MSTSYLLPFVACMLSMPLSMTSQNEIDAHKIDHEITIDGHVTDAEWQTTPILSITQKVPNAGAEPTQKTEIRIAYDHEYLYLSGRLFDAEPHKIIANTKKRDHFTENTEWVGLLIDSYNDRKNALAFFITPNGAKLDMALSNDVQGPNAFNTSWNEDWESAAIQNGEGWFAEMKIPFSSLAFQQINEKTIMGITSFRYLARNDETDIYPPRDLSTGSTFRPSLTQRFSFTNISEKKKVRITPYVLGGVSHLSLSNDIPIDNVLSNKYEIGLDLRLPINNKLQLDLTYNTDFAQVEADDQQVNLTRSGIFFPEKRLFFQENANLFDFNFGGNDKLFHSRNIGISNGAQVPILGGIKAYSKMGPWTNGLIAMRTASTQSNAPENFLVYRIRRKIINEQSTMGMMFTYRSTQNHGGNSLGLDSDIHLGKSIYLNSRIAVSQDERRTEQFGAKSYIELEKRSQLGWTYNFNFGAASTNYASLLGFQSRSNFIETNANISYNLFPNQASTVLQHGPFLRNKTILNYNTRQLASAYRDIGYLLNTKNGFTFSIGFNHTTEQIDLPISFTEKIEISAGRTSFVSANVQVLSPTAGNFSYLVNAEIGSFYSGTKYSLYTQPTVNINPDWNVSLSYGFNHINMPLDDRNRAIEQLHLFNITSLYTLSTKLSINVNAQFNSQFSKFIAGLRMRYNPTEGTDLYIVYNGEEDTIDRQYEQYISRKKQQTLLVKFSHTLRIQ